MMASHFDREFMFLDEAFLANLRSLEAEGCLYEYLHQGDGDDFAHVRIRLQPAEMVRYVDGLFAYEEFLRGISKGFSETEALATISSMMIRHAVEAYNEWARGFGAEDQQNCPAAFLGAELEELTCSNVLNRHEVLGRTYQSDRRFLLDEIVSGLADAASFLGSRQGGREPYLLQTEQDVRDLLYTIIKPIFPDAVIEDPAPKLAGGSKRVDIALGTIRTIVELKFVRDAGHASRVADELRTDIESYHSHPRCGRLLCVIWDGERHLRDRAAIVRDLAGPRRKGTATFAVDVRIVP